MIPASERRSSVFLKTGSIWVFPKIGGFYPPKWMVKIMVKTLLKLMIWGYPYFWKHPFFLWENNPSDFSAGSDLGASQAGKTVAAIVRTTLGPRAMLKMLCGAMDFSFRGKRVPQKAMHPCLVWVGFLRIALRMLGF